MPKHSKFSFVSFAVGAAGLILLVGLVFLGRAGKLSIIADQDPPGSGGDSGDGPGSPISFKTVKFRLKNSKGEGVRGFEVYFDPGKISATAQPETKTELKHKQIFEKKVIGFETMRIKATKDKITYCFDFKTPRAWWVTTETFGVTTPAARSDAECAKKPTRVEYTFVGKTLVRKTAGGDRDDAVLKVTGPKTFSILSPGRSVTDSDGWAVLSLQPLSSEIIGAGTLASIDSQLKCATRNYQYGDVEKVLFTRIHEILFDCQISDDGEQG